MKNVSLAFLACASLIATSIYIDAPKDVLNICDPSIPLTFQQEPKESEEFKVDAGVHDHECDKWHGYKVYDEKCIVEKTLLQELSNEIEHKGLLLVFKK